MIISGSESTEDTSHLTLPAIQRRMSLLAGGQYYPLWINTQTEEPFLRLNAHKNVIITPPGSSDAPQLCTLLNHPLIQEWTDIPSLPYHLGNVCE